MTELSTNIVVEQEAAAVLEEDDPQRTIRIVLPAYNEENSLGALLLSIHQTMKFHGLGYEVTILDDGSRDRTLDIARKYSRKIPMRILRHIQNAGLGETIRDGLMDCVKRAGENDIIVTMDADNSHTPGLIFRMVLLIDGGCDVVIASRFVSGSQIAGMPLYRTLLSRCASCLCRLLFPIRGVRDYTSGFRACRARDLKAEFGKYGPSFVQEDGFQCIVDILLKMSRSQLVFGEIPLILRYDLKRGRSKMRVGTTMLNTLRLLLRRRFEFWFE